MGSTGREPPHFTKGKLRPEGSVTPREGQDHGSQQDPWGQGRAYSQHNQTGEILEGKIRDTADVIERQGHSLQGRQVVEGPDGDLGEGIVVQPQVAEAGQPLEAPLRDQGDEVGIQAPGGKEDGEGQCRQDTDRGLELDWVGQPGPQQASRATRPPLTLCHTPASSQVSPLPSS